jgi:hypothetical protein
MLALSACLALQVAVAHPPGFGRGPVAALMAKARAARYQQDSALGERLSRGISGG